MPLPCQRGAVQAKWLIGVVAVVAVVGIAAYLTLVQLQRGNTTTLSTVTLGPHDLGDLERQALEDAVRQAAGEHLEQRVTVSTEAASVGASRQALGLSIDVDATVDAVWSRGRQGIFRGLSDQLAARRGDPIEVHFEAEIDEGTLADWTRQASENLSRQPRPAGIGFIHAEEPDGVDVHAVEPVPGREISQEGLTRRIRTALEETYGPVELEDPGERIQPEVTMDDLEAALPQARLAVSAPVILQNPSAGPDLEVSPAELVHILAVVVDPDAEAGNRLVVSGDVDAFREHLAGRLEALEASPVPATFEVVNDQVNVSGGLPGFEVDVQASLGRLVEAALTEAPRAGELAGQTTPPDFTREQAEALGIQERVSSFTTEYSCCPPRVTNIQRAADIVNGTIIPPGERLSLNQAIGPRTRARGFVSNGYIEDGELRTAVGGGVSQIATTFFNAAWFAGIRIPDYKPHSLYIDRYPMGREATLDWNVIDVVVENDSPHGILIQTSYTNTSVTFEFWSTRWAEVQTQTSEPTNFRSGSSRDGFDVSFSRTITYPDGTSRTEEHFHRYQPES